MKRRFYGLMAAGCLLAMAAPSAQAEQPLRWITASAAVDADARKQPVALQFRRDVVLPRAYRSFPVRVSADNRYLLFVNGRRVAAGPARGDLQHWRYEVIDLGPYLKRGRNVVAAQVWNDAKFAPLAQISSGRTAFLLVAENAEQAPLIGDPRGWRVRVDTSRSLASGVDQLTKQVGGTYYVAGSPETIDGAQLVPDWAQPRSLATGWQETVPVATAPWVLVRDPLPQMRYHRVPSGRVARASAPAYAAFATQPVTIPANSEANLLIDAGRLLAAYPALRTSGGAGASITVTYTEALYDPAAEKKTNDEKPRFHDRATIGNGIALGLIDTFKPSGGSDLFQPFWWRAWRFAEIKVKTGAEPLTLERFDTYETGYPFEQRGRFVSDDPELNEIWRIGWMTALIDAHETYMDTAYWEQLQYIGDTRIQMLLSYDVAGDPRLAIQALEAFDHSRVVEGLPQSAYPSSGKNLIPPFALLWIGSLHDYWMRQPDPAVVRRALPGMRSVLDWYAAYVKADGLVRPTPGWPFVDWVGPLNGYAVKDGRGPDNCVITMLYYGALREAADLEVLGDPARAPAYRQQAAKVRAGLDDRCWDASRGLYADTPAKNQFSQHANALAVLYDLVPKARQREVLDKIMVPGGGKTAPKGILETSYYFSFYLARALDHAGLTDRYLGLLKPWRDMVRQNLTTWPEEGDPSRSDSHAWSAHPTSGLLTYVAGIQPSAPGFARVRVSPNLGLLKRVEAAMAHPRGRIETRYRIAGERLRATVTLPTGLDGTFEWQGQSAVLRPGRNRIDMRSSPTRRRQD